MTVSEAEIAAAVRIAAEEVRLVVEPSGALAIAALRFHRTEAGLDGSTGPVVAIASGGNVDPERYRYVPRGADPRLTDGAEGLGGSAAAAGAATATLAALAGEPFGEHQLAGMDHGHLGVGRTSRRAVSRSSKRIQPATHRTIPVTNTRSPMIHIRPPARCWSTSADGPQESPKFA